MGQFSNNPILDRVICESHDRWVTRTPDYYEHQDEDEEEMLEDLGFSDEKEDEDK